MSPWRRDLRRLLAIFPSPKRTFTEIGDTPGVGAMLLLFGVGALTRLPVLGLLLF